MSPSGKIRFGRFTDPGKGPFADDGPGRCVVTGARRREFDARPTTGADRDAQP